MADRCLSFTATAPGRFLTRRLGLPQPAALPRWSPEHPSLTGSLLQLTAGTTALDRAPALSRTGLPLAGPDSTTGDRPALPALHTGADQPSRYGRACGQNLLGA